MTTPGEAILLAAGMGTRLGDHTKCQPKPLVQVNGVPILRNALNQLARAGVTRATVVIGHLGDQIRAAIGDRIGAMSVAYAVNERYRTTGTAVSLMLGLEHARGDVLVVEGDVFFDGTVLEHFLAEPSVDATLVQRWNSALDGSVVELCPDGFVARWLHKSARAEGFRLEGTFKTVNLHRFSAPFVDLHLHPSLASASARPDEPIESAFGRAVDGNGRIRAVEVRGPWVEIDDEYDLRTAEALFPGGGDGPR